MDTLFEHEVALDIFQENGEWHVQQPLSPPRLSGSVEPSYAEQDATQIGVIGNGKSWRLVRIVNGEIVRRRRLRPPALSIWRQLVACYPDSAPQSVVVLTKRGNVPRTRPYDNLRVALQHLQSPWALQLIKHARVRSHGEPEHRIRLAYMHPFAIADRIVEPIDRTITDEAGTPRRVAPSIFLGFGIRNRFAEQPSHAAIVDHVYGREPRSEKEIERRYVLLVNKMAYVRRDLGLSPDTGGKLDEPPIQQRGPIDPTRADIYLPSLQCDADGLEITYKRQPPKVLTPAEWRVLEILSTGDELSSANLAERLWDDRSLEDDADYVVFALTEKLQELDYPSLPAIDENDSWELTKVGRAPSYNFGRIS
jgi:hypothetical protein